VRRERCVDGVAESLNKGDRVIYVMPEGASSLWATNVCLAD
jgi:hypothetical protein